MPKSPADDTRLEHLIDAALAGARAVMAVYGTDLRVGRKADDSPVSEADLRAEAAIAARLSEAFPEIPVVAEEAASASRPENPGRLFLLVDPLDGTKEFINRNGEFTVNVALIEDGLPIAGIVIAPALGLAYCGNSGGAWKASTEPTLARIDGWTAIRPRLAASPPVAVASRSHMNAATEAALAQAQCGDSRSIGSSLKFCLIAEGSADFYPRLGPTMEWDTAAGDAVLRAAGGIVATLEGEPLRYGKHDESGVRPFENPHFLAAGDPGILARLDLAALKAKAA